MQNTVSNESRDFNYLFAVAARKDGQGFIEVVIGVLTAVMLLLLVVFVIILILSRRQKLQGSPTLLRNPFGVTINMKVSTKYLISPSTNIIDDKFNYCLKF